MEIICFYWVKHDLMAISEHMYMLPIIYVLTPQQILF
jgi:hypothetical protein